MDLCKKNFLVFLLCLASLTVIQTNPVKEDNTIEKSDQKIQIFPPELESHLLNGMFKKLF